MGIEVVWWDPKREGDHGILVRFSPRDFGESMCEMVDEGMKSAVLAYRNITDITEHQLWDKVATTP